MAASALPAPGTTYGPCEECGHTDCAETRRMAEMPCWLCDQPIGYGVDFYNITTEGQPFTKLAHALCAEENAS